MKKLTVLSIMAASLLLVGCGDSSSTETKAEKPAAHEAMKCGEGKCGGDKKAPEKKEAMKCGEGKCGGDMKAKATEAVAKAKEVVSETAEKAKDVAKGAAAAVAAKATEAVAAVTGPDGKALYAKCAGCHGADGKTKALAKAAPLAGQSADDLATKMAGYKAGTLNTHGMGALMKGQVASYSDADIKAVAAYISGL